jgi:hypothetical protein
MGERVLKCKLGQSMAWGKEQKRAAQAAEAFRLTSLELPDTRT